jgi:type II secretory pathway pseudopilin PulG
MKIVSHERSGLTRVEILVVVAIITLLGGLLIPSCPKGRVRAERIKCLSNLKDIGLALRSFSNDHGDRFPWRVPVSRGGAEMPPASPDPTLQYLAVASNLFTPKVLACPADKDVVKAASFANLSRTNISYFISLDADEGGPQTLLSGDRNLTGGAYSNGIYYLPTQSGKIGWSPNIHRSAGNVALSDGSAQQVTAGGLNRQLQTMSNQTIRLIVP